MYSAFTLCSRLLGPPRCPQAVAVAIVFGYLDYRTTDAEGKLEYKNTNTRQVNTQCSLFCMAIEGYIIRNPNDSDSTMAQAPRSNHRIQRVFSPSLWRSCIPPERLLAALPSPWRKWHAIHSAVIPDPSFSPAPILSMVPYKKIAKPKGESSQSKESGRGYDILAVTQLSQETWNNIKACIRLALCISSSYDLLRHLSRNDVKISSIIKKHLRSRTH